MSKIANNPTGKREAKQQKINHTTNNTDTMHKQESRADKKGTHNNSLLLARVCRHLIQKVFRSVRHFPKHTDRNNTRALNRERAAKV